MNRSLLIIFVKNPVLGKVKTRLAATVGDEAALAVYFQLLKKTYEVTVPLPVDKIVYYSDFVDHDDLWSKGEYEKRVQSGNDLGERMKNAFKESFERGYQKVCIIGSDCLEITTGILNQAFSGLEGHDAAIGPAKDGGYYLLGMRQMIPPLFEKKEWSTDQVFKSTITNFEQLDLGYMKLPVLNDVDDEKDLDAVFNLNKTDDLPN